MIIDSPRKERFFELRSLWKEAFGDTDEFLTAFERTAFSTDRCRCVIIDGKAVAALYWFDCHTAIGRVAYLYAVATAKARRGKGLCRALMQDTHRHLKTLGYEGAILVPGSKKLFDFYQKIGYRICSSIDEFYCSASVKSTEVVQIDENQFAKLRRRFLPAGGVIQENENLKFLKTMANFYTGNGFLLAARREADTLYCMELLGDTSAAPAIVQALGCIEGRFRIPGIATPFAMYHSLGNDRYTPPDYFGLAFD